MILNIDIELKGFYKRMAELGYTVTLSDDAKNFIASKGCDVNFGARPLKRAIQKYLEDELAELLLGSSVSLGDEILVGFDPTEQKIVTQIVASSQQPQIEQ